MNRYTYPKIAHPEWIDDAMERSRDHLAIHLRDPMPETIRGFMLATDARRLLRGIYGGDFRAAFALLVIAIGGWFSSLQPLWLLEWRLKRMERRP